MGGLRGGGRAWKATAPWCALFIVLREHCARIALDISPCSRYHPRTGPTPIQRLGNGTQRPRADERNQWGFFRRARSGPGQPPLFSGRGIFLLCRPGVDQPGGLLQGRGRVVVAMRPDPGRQMDARLDGEDRGGHVETSFGSVPVGAWLGVHLDQRGEARPVPLPRGPRDGRVPTQTEESRGELLPGWLLYISGLH